ncbi:MAG: hypothetical protein ABJG68_16930 [Crocinitomicaceae bacterium]
MKFITSTLLILIFTASCTKITEEQNPYFDQIIGEWQLDSIEKIDIYTCDDERFYDFEEKVDNKGLIFHENSKVEKYTNSTKENLGRSEFNFTGTLNDFRFGCELGTYYFKNDTIRKINLPEYQGKIYCFDTNTYGFFNIQRNEIYLKK